MPQDHQLLPEWVKQEAIILAWPDEQTDWAPWLDKVTQTYLDLITAINMAGVSVVLLCRADKINTTKALLNDQSRVVLIAADYNDTWVRDYGFLTCQSRQGLRPIEFTFNGWGNKFEADLDNRINQDVLFELCKLDPVTYNYVVEGGALEIDDQGTLLSTELCLTNPQRNSDMALAEYQEMFAIALGSKQSMIFEHGHLEGDDTDGHVDTLVRFTPNKGLVVQSCFNRPEDPHFDGLNALLEECQKALPDHQIYQLPLPEIYNRDKERLPASYANYLICNGHVLAPIYQQKEDKQALEVLEKAYPEFKIVPIDALPLIQQFGSIHCISMQVPEGTFKSAFVNNFNAGVSVYEKQ